MEPDEENLAIDKQSRVFSSYFNVAYEAYRAAAPYIQNLQWLQELLNSLLARTEDLDTLRHLLEREKENQQERLKRTDLEIYPRNLDKTRRFT